MKDEMGDGLKGEEDRRYKVERVMCLELGFFPGELKGMKMILRMEKERM